MVSGLRENISVLLISGNEIHHAPQLKRFREYLVTNAAIDPGNIVHLSGRKYHNEQILEQSRSVIHDAREKRDTRGQGFLVVAYHGHGLPSGICVDGTPVSYYALADALGFDMSFLFINSCCYSGAAIDAFRACGLLPSFGSVITSSRSYKPSYGAVFLEALVDSWKEGKEFRRRKMYVLIKDETEKAQADTEKFPKLRTYAQIPTRSGISLDHILYPMR
ncbi:hypothetical protein HZC31_02875 [Candidatus Woesearchaeota archaeon]|nr:hypothetical protein [Candidatus Woesearchaeota archaeon]